MSSVYIENNIVYVQYNNNFGEKKGMTYELGANLIGFLNIDVDYLYEEYSKIQFFIGSNYSLSDKVFCNELKYYIDSLDAYCPYLHNYTQGYINFIYNYPTEGSSAYMEFANTVTDMIEVYEESSLSTWRASVDIKVDLEIPESLLYDWNWGELIRNPNRNFNEIKVNSVFDNYNFALDLILLDIKAKQIRLASELEYIVDSINKHRYLSPTQRLYLIDYKRSLDAKKPCYIENGFESRLVLNKEISKKINNESDMEKYIVQSDINIVRMYDAFTLDDLIRFELLNVITEDIVIKKCAYCKRFFIPKGRVDTQYCEEIAEGENKSCKEIAAAKIHMEKTINNPIGREYLKAYRRMNSRERQRKISYVEFSTWSQEARGKRDACLNGNISFEEFQKWLDKDKKLIKIPLKIE